MIPEPQPLTPEDCVLQAQEISRVAETVADPGLRIIYLQIAEAWLDLSQFSSLEDDAEAAMLELIRLLLRQHAN